MCHCISIKYPCCKEQCEISHKPCAAAVRKGKQNTKQIGVSLCPTMNCEHKLKFLKTDCGVCALRKRYFEPEFNLEKRFQQKMKCEKFKPQLRRTIFKPASTADKSLENHARRQHELAMETLRRERLEKIDRMYCLLEKRHYLTN